MSPCVSRPFHPRLRIRHYRLPDSDTTGPSSATHGKDDGGGRDAEEQILTEACRVVDDGHPTTDHRTRLLLWDLVMADDGIATGNCPPRGGCILFKHSTDAKSQRPSCSMLLPCRRSSSDLDVTCARPCFSRGTSSWNRSPLFRCFWWASSLRPPMVPWMNEARCWPASASSSRIRWVLCWRASTLTPLRVGQQLHGLPLVVAGSQPLLLHATRRIRLRFSKMQAATISDNCSALCWRPLPRGFPASCSWFRLRLPQPLGRGVWRDQDRNQLAR